MKRRVLSCWLHLIINNYCPAVLSERDAWVRMPAIKSPCGACAAAMPCPKARASSLFQRHRAARASLARPMRIRYGLVQLWT